MSISDFFKKNVSLHCYKENKFDIIIKQIKTTNYNELKGRNRCKGSKHGKSNTYEEKQMRIAIVDDNEEDRKYLTKEITEIFSEKTKENPQITQLSSGEEFVKVLSVSEPGEFFDIVFLDIYVKELTGIDTAKKLRQIDKVAKIIFITTSNEFASESYEVQAHDYLIKPFNKARMLKTMERIFEDEKNNKKILDLPDGQIIPIDSLLYTTFSGHYVTIYLIDGNKIQLRCTQKNFEACIQEHKELVQCFKGIVVNITKVDGLEEDRFKLINKEYVPISRRKYAEVKKSYTDYLIERLRQGEDI